MALGQIFHFNFFRTVSCLNLIDTVRCAELCFSVTAKTSSRGFLIDWICPVRFYSFSITHSFSVFTLSLSFFFPPSCSDTFFLYRCQILLFKLGSAWASKKRKPPSFSKWGKSSCHTWNNHVELTGWLSDKSSSGHETVARDVYWAVLSVMFQNSHRGEKHMMIQYNIPER